EDADREYPAPASEYHGARPQGPDGQQEYPRHPSHRRAPPASPALRGTRALMFSLIELAQARGSHILSLLPAYGSRARYCNTRDGCSVSVLFSTYYRLNSINPLRTIRE